MSYKFQPFVKVPTEIISRIGTDIGVQFFGELNIQLPHLEESDVKMIMTAYGEAVALHAENHVKSVDGYTLDRHSVIEISNCLRDGHKINAIKIFRSQTNADLIDSKNFIEKFMNNHQGAEEFVEAFSM